ncbi:HepT-like ribonuclease domain-containing protein [Actinophytocola sediminis]
MGDTETRELDAESFREFGARAVDPNVVFAGLARIRDLLDDLAASSVGMRNLLVHEYLEIDVEQVAAAVPLALDGYRRYVAAVAGFVTRG